MFHSQLIAFWRCFMPWFAVALVIPSFAAPRITEFMASNESGLADEDGAFSDWIEIHNPDATAVSLANYSLTDNPSNLNKWRFPAVTLQPGAYLVVFASGKNRIDPTRQLHTDFNLSSDGEYLALVAPDGSTVLSSFAPMYPEQFENVSFGMGGTAGTPLLSFFTPPTPGAANGTGTPAGPTFLEVVENPPQPAGGPLTVTATVVGANASVTGLTLYYRTMFAAEVQVAMRNDGTSGDTNAADDTWTAVIPANAFVPGEMTRWRYVARDSRGTETKEPAYRATLDSHQYFGTVTRDEGIQTRLPVLHWFTSNPNGAGTTTGSRGAVYYDGEFYDNVLFNVHGQSTAGFQKKSYNIDFNRTQRFRWSTNAPRVADIDLLTNWADKSKVRHVLGYEVMRESGVKTHFAFTVRVEQNGNFFSTADFVEDADEIYLERAGLNPEGALYKVYSNQLNKDAGNTANAGVEKKTRKTENNTDLQALIDGLDLTGAALTNYLFDNIDIAACVNMLAANSVIRNIDMHSKNWYIYRDTGRSGEWSILPWDLDLSHGRVWNQQNTYFDNQLYTDGFVVTGTSIRLVQQLFSTPATRSMIMRRVRTLTDRFLQPPPAAGTPESDLYYERRLNEQSALIDPPTITPSDAQRDFVKWGSWLQGGTTVSYTNTNAAVESMAEAIQRWKTQYLPQRRNHIYNTQVVGRGGEIPLPQTSVANVSWTPILSSGAAAKVYVPTNSSLGVTWIGIGTYEPFNTGGWMTGTTGVGYERGSGYETLIGANVNTQMASNTSVYVRIEFDVPDPSQFQRLELRMKYDDGFIAFLNGAVLASANAPASPVWNSAATAQHEASATLFDVFDVTDKRANLRTGRNVLAIQGLNDVVTSSDMLVLPELYGGRVVNGAAVQPVIQFGPIEVDPASGNQDEEYIQLVNANSIAVDISDWKLTGGVEHTFHSGTVIPPNGSLFVSPNVAAFRGRAASPRRGEGRFVQGNYSGHLSNFGETIRLIDSSGMTNNTTTYAGQPSDAQRYLVVSEVMYRPAGDGLAEFIELLNISTNTTLNLNSVRLTQGVEFDFTGSSITSLAPGARALIVRDRAAFSAAYGTNLPVAGVFTNASALSNGGELIKVEDADNGTIREFIYDDAAPWPAGTDGTGYSIVLIAPETNPDPAVATNWRSSARPGGSPGTTDAVTFPAAPNGDSNKNGEPDLIDYALGNDLGLAPLQPAFRLSPAGTGGTTLQMSYPVSIGAEHATLDVQFSTNLSEWMDAAQHMGTISSRQLGDGRMLVTCDVLPSIIEGGRVFLRLRVTAK